MRLDATITYRDEGHSTGAYAHEHDEVESMGDDFIKVYSPTEGDECYVGYDAEEAIDATASGCVDQSTVAWWHMNDGRVLGVYPSGHEPRG